MNNREEQGQILKDTFVNILADCKKFLNTLESVRDNSTLLLIAGVDNGVHVRMSLIMGGSHENIMETIVKAMLKNGEIARLFLMVSKKFMEQKLNQIISDTSIPDDFEDLINDIMPNDISIDRKECNCPQCKAQRKANWN